MVDWMLPGMSGVELAKRLRRDELIQSPAVTDANGTKQSDILKSFESGIDDYMSKPFSPKELVARIKALLRRSGAPTDDLLEASGIRIDLVSHRVTIDGVDINIGPTEYRLLELLMRNPDRVFERDQLLDRVWGRSRYIETRTVDVHVLDCVKSSSPLA